jgi:hypothetical protein
VRSLGFTLRNVAEWFASVRGRRKTILFVSEGIDYDIYDIIAPTGSTHHDASSVSTRRARDRGGGRANVSIYGIDRAASPTSATRRSRSVRSRRHLARHRPGQLANELRLSQDSLRVLSETGGFAVVNQGDFNTPTTASSRQQLVDVMATTRRCAAGTRAPRSTCASAARIDGARPEGARHAEGTSGAVAQDVRTPEIKDALDSPLPISGLTMQVFAAPFKGAAPNASVLFGVEIRGRDLRLANNDRLQLSYYAIDAQGKVRGGNTDAVTLSLKPETKARIEQQGVRMLNRMDLPPGRYQLRFATHDAGGGAVGSVLYDLEVPDFAKAPISMSGIVLTSMAGAMRPTVRPDEQLRGVLPASPVALRSFPQDDELAIFAEIYDNSASSPHKVDITATVTTDEGRVMFKTDEQRDSSDLGGKSGGYGFSAKIPMKELAPGPYVLTVSARSRIGSNTTVQRQVRINVLGK